MHAMRTALLGAVSAGLGLAGCGERTTTGAKTAPETAAASTVVRVVAVASASAAPAPTTPDASAPASADAGPPKTASPQAPCVSPRRYCLKVGDDPPDGMKGRVDPTPSTPKRTTCLPAKDIYSICNGLRAFTGPVRQGDQCCYDVCSEAVPCGRPLIVEGAPRVARPVARDDWRSTLGGPSHASAAPLLADAWIADGLAEHASVASFGRVALELLARGAPSELGAATHRAALDEVEHARTCFAIAARLDPARGEIGPGPMSLEGLTLDASPATFAARLVREGCVGETLAALVLTEAAACCEDPVITEAVARMAAEEAAHAALAFRTAAWLVATHGAAVRDAIRGEARRARDVGVPDLGPGAAERAARLRPPVIARVLEAGLRDVVGPCLAALVAA